jgi:uncharacterized membrane protein YjgN (DUF898 family)
MATILPGAIPQTGAEANTTASVKFTGSANDFVSLCMRGAFFQLITFGFYRFWLATDIRRHLWSGTSIDGEPLEYTGRARELLIGFLIALAILVPVQLAYFLLGLQAERARAFASLPLFLFYALFGQFAVFRARRYRLTRTIWRGVRFWMTGSGWKYAFRWLGWALLSCITLGLAYPWMRASLERYKLNNTYYGDLQGSFVGSGAEFFKRGIIMWLGCVGILILVAGAEYEVVTGSGGRESASTLIFLTFLLLLLLIPIVWPFFRALEWRWWAQGVRFGDLTLASELRGASLLKTYLKMMFFALIVAIGMAILASLVGYLLATLFGVSTSFRANDIASAMRNLPAIIIMTIAYLIVLLSIGVVQKFYLTRDMWRIIATSISVSHLEATIGVAARGEAANALGEGLADGLDVAGF